MDGLAFLVWRKEGVRKIILYKRVLPYRHAEMHLKEFLISIYDSCAHEKMLVEENLCDFDGQSKFETPIIQEDY